MGRPYCGSVGDPVLGRAIRSSTARRRSRSPTAAGRARRRRTRCRRSNGPSTSATRYLETDVHVTADGVVVAFHDDDLPRTCNVPGLIHELPWARSPRPASAGKEPIPRLAELFEAFPDTRINIDCKTDGVVGPLGDELERMPASLDRVCVGSFKRRRLRGSASASAAALCTSAGPVELGAAPRDGVRRGRARWPPRCRRGARGPRSSRRRFVRTLPPPRRRGPRLDDRRPSTRWTACSTSASTAIMTDVPAMLKDVLGRRGQWHRDGRRRPRPTTPDDRRGDRAAEQHHAAGRRQDGPAPTSRSAGLRGGGDGRADDAGVGRGDDPEHPPGRPQPHHTATTATTVEQRDHRPPAQRRRRRAVRGEPEAADDAEHVVAVAAAAPPCAPTAGTSRRPSARPHRHRDDRGGRPPAQGPAQRHRGTRPSAGLRERSVAETC